MEKAGAAIKLSTDSAVFKTAWWLGNANDNNMGTVAYSTLADDIALGGEEAELEGGEGRAGRGVEVADGRSVVPRALAAAGVAGTAAGAAVEGALLLAHSEQPAQHHRPAAAHVPPQERNPFLPI